MKLETAKIGFHGTIEQAIDRINAEKQSGRWELAGYDIFEKAKTVGSDNTFKAKAFVMCYYKSHDGAALNLTYEICDWDFDDEK
ncbi:MAG: hypothetical protein KME29_04750 [Calothrix sp. FI2-JRJ7]|jgi:hypothetical protein|nr:hypothetical protein [Calothrix sp. FI2-JRJ7]